jgi:hypothetical protein
MARGHLAIIGPTRETVPAAFAVDLAQLYAYTRERGPWKQVTLGLKISTYIHGGREQLLEEAIRLGASDVLWIDTDMSVPPETAIRLARHEVPIVGCNYPTRDGSSKPTAVRHGWPVVTTAASIGLEAVDGCGFGVLLIDVALARALPRPWFQHGVNDMGGDIGEDLMWGRAARAAGHTVYIDHELSQEIGHIGQTIYRFTGALAPQPV